MQLCANEATAVVTMREELQVQRLNLAGPFMYYPGAAGGRQGEYASTVETSENCNISIGDTPISGPHTLHPLFRLLGTSNAGPGTRRNHKHKSKLFRVRVGTEEFPRAS